MFNRTRNTPNTCRSSIFWADKIRPLVNFHGIQTKDSHNLLYCEIVGN